VAYYIIRKKSNKHVHWDGHRWGVTAELAKPYRHDELPDELPTRNMPPCGKATRCDLRWRLNGEIVAEAVECLVSVESCIERG